MHCAGTLFARPLVKLGQGVAPGHRPQAWGEAVAVLAGLYSRLQSAAALNGDDKNAHLKVFGLTQACSSVRDLYPPRGAWVTVRRPSWERSRVGVQLTWDT